MVRGIPVMLLVALLLCSCAQERPQIREINGKKYELVFADDFDEKKLDGSKWELCPEWQRQDVGGYWDDSMVSLRDGNLVLTAGFREDGTPISGAVRSRGRFSQNKGYFEARCRLQKASGFWSAFWLMDPDMRDEPGRGAEDGAEIDIMESFDVHSGGINHAIHWDGYGEHHQSAVKAVYDPAYYEDYHLFALEWTDTEYIFYIDGEETWRTSDPGMCENELYLKLTTEFGSWAAPIIPEQYPDEFLTDYVRVYKLVE